MKKFALVYIAALLICGSSCLLAMPPEVVPQVQVIEHVGVIHKDAAGFFLKVPATETVAEQNILLAAHSAAVEEELLALHQANVAVRLRGVAALRAGRAHLVVLAARRRR